MLFCIQMCIYSVMYSVCMSIKMYYFRSFMIFFNINSITYT